MFGQSAPFLSPYLVQHPCPDTALSDIPKSSRSKMHPRFPVTSSEYSPHAESSLITCMS